MTTADVSARLSDAARETARLLGLNLPKVVDSDVVAFVLLNAEPGLRILQRQVDELREQANGLLGAMTNGDDAATKASFERLQATVDKHWDDYAARANRAQEAVAQRVPEPGYLVKWGWSGQSQRRFETFEEALVWMAWKHGRVSVYERKGLQLVCPDRIDGADDSQAHHQVGLTEEQWERVQEVLSWGR